MLSSTLVFLLIIGFKYQHILNLNTTGWKDPAWTDVRSVRPGIDGDEKENRELVFGKNLIDIKQKSIPQLLVDEVFRRLDCHNGHVLTI
jgi:hypothetical protein